jgi:hypothetical protein
LRCIVFVGAGLSLRFGGLVLSRSLDGSRRDDLSR